MDKLGIGSFVYRSTVPFDAGRLMNVLNRWPVPIKDELDIGLIQEAQVEGYEMEDGKDRGSPFVGVLRSKGFCWLAPARWTGNADDSWRHDTAMFWSHAGKHFGITTAGKWWGTLAKERVKDYFGNNMGEYERVMKEDWVTEEFGDRRQEIVFIGTQLDEAVITEVLDACLCTDEDMDQYRQQLRNLIDTTFSSEAIGGFGPSLFDVVGTEHLDMN
jgi:G3E family GTPase